MVNILNLNSITIIYFKLYYNWWWWMEIWLMDLLKVGDIIYEHGIIILTNDGIESTGEDGYRSINYGTRLFMGIVMKFL